MPKRLYLPYVITPLLVLANIAYLWHSAFAAIMTLGFFLVIPGYLLLQKFKHNLQSPWEVLALSMGLSLFILTFGGLVLNSFHAFGLTRPLTTHNILIWFDSITAILIALNLKRHFVLPKVQFQPTYEQILVGGLCTLLPFMAAGGAMRLNNNGSNILTMVVMGIIAILFVLMVVRPGLRPMYPYVIFTVGLSILFGNSLRGWFITGHDIHHEFNVFQATIQGEYWRPTTSKGDPYNACLSITLLPTLLAKLVHFRDAYIYKMVYQVLFAAFLPSLFYIFKRFAEPRIAVLGVFAFMTFPTFTNDLPFLNRQEIAFIFFILLMFVSFSNMARRTKAGLSIIFIITLILSHYSSSYVTLCLLLMAPLFYRFFSRALPKTYGEGEALPLMRVPVILAALLCTFIWNAQVTASTGNLTNTITGTIGSLIGSDSKKGSFSYNLFSPPTSNVPQKTFNEYAATQDGAAKLLPKDYMPVQPLGHFIATVLHFKNLQFINTLFHALLAKVLQMLVVFGMILIMLKRKELFAGRLGVYFLSLACACMAALVLFTVLPQLAVDYDVTRLFQQSLVLLWLPSVLIAQKAFFFTKRYRLQLTAGLFGFLYLNLSGFIPQLTGGFPAQLPLNNAGVYYDYFYNHRSDVLGVHWLEQKRNVYKNVYTDTVSDLPSRNFLLSAGLLKGDRVGYLLVGNTDNKRDRYRIIIQGEFMQYNNSKVVGAQNTVYSSGYTRIYLNNGK